MIPEGFKEKMRRTLGDEYDAFINAIENESAVRAFRSNLIKTDGTDPFGAYASTARIPYVDNGYYLRDGIKIGNTPEHHAGMVYAQDPGAMATVSAVEIQSDMKVADLCAAPGGKTSQIAERLGDNGFILSNEFVPKRAKIIVGNLERLGVKNAVVTSMDTSALAELYPDFFDIVIVDAPCSGEGMFRKSEDAVSDWSMENVLACAERQKQIIKNGAAMVRPGGKLLYSTCTYSEEENEQIIAYLLSERDDFSIEKVSERVCEVTRDGISRENYPTDISRCRRFYPHLTPGEGQFLALLKRSDRSDDKKLSITADNTCAPSKSEHRTVERFFIDVLGKIPCGKLVKSGENIILIQHGCPIPRHSVFMSGVLVGELRKDIIKPSHQFFSCFGNDFVLKVELDDGDPRVKKYLHGEEISCDPTMGDGWCAVMYRYAPIGGGKISRGTVKNHYPKGLRTS